MHVGFRQRLTYSRRRGPVGISDVIETNLMDSIRNVCHFGCVNEIRHHRPRPWRLICLRSSYGAALHTVRVQLWHLTSRGGGVELNRVGYLIAIHWLREMDLEWDGYRRGHTIVVPWEELGDDWYRSYEFIFWDKHFVTPRCKVYLGKAAGEWLSGIVVFQDAMLAQAGSIC